MLKQYILIAALLCCQLMTVEAQEMSLYFMNGIAQSTDVNPSFMPDKKTIYSFPDIYGGVSNSIGSYNGMIMENAEGTTVLNTAALLANAKSNNYIRQNFGLTTFRTMYGKDRWRASVTHSIKQNTLFSYPKGLVELLANGNAAHLDETLEVGPDMELNLYSETAFGFMMRINKLTVGGRVKLLSGIANVSTANTKANVTTDSEYYELAVETDYQINAGGLFSIEGLVNDQDVEIDFEDEDLSFGRLFKSPNLGLDLGANMVLLNDKLMLSASIIDFGRINWKQNAKNYSSKGTYDFSGVDLNDAIDDGDAGEGLLDSLENAFDFVESESSYRTMLPTKIYLSARYKAHRMLSLGVLSYLETYRGEVYNGLAIDATTHLGKIVDFGVTGSYVYRSPNLGAHLALKFGPFQIIAASDNLLALMNPANHQHTTARFGMNLAFGKKYAGDSPNPVD